MKINPTLSRDEVYPPKRFLWRTAKKIIMIIKLVFQFEQEPISNRLLIPWDACGTPTVKIRFGCTQNCKASR